MNAFEFDFLYHAIVYPSRGIRLSAPSSSRLRARSSLGQDSLWTRVPTRCTGRRAEQGQPSLNTRQP